LDYESLELLEAETAEQKAKFPYAPTLLSFRELPVAIACIKKLKLQPDIFLVDAHGIAHPSRCGFASHLGLVLNKPTVGVAKNRLFGEPKQMGKEVFLVDDGEVIGAEVCTRKDAKPVYVSIGHMVSLKTATRIVKHCARSSRIPEPILQAHRLASEKRKAQIAKSTLGQ
jgi:deoxyribonuclease V